MDYRNLVKRLVLPDGATAPARLEHAGVVATAITRHDLADDVRGINASLDIIQQTRGGAWPTGPVTEDYNYVDLVWHGEFRDASSYTYVVRNAAGYYSMVYDGLRHWLATDFPFWKPHYSNAQIP
jgi:hypothetical protein